MCKETIYEYSVAKVLPLHHTLCHFRSVLYVFGGNGHNPPDQNPLTKASPDRSPLNLVRGTKSPVRIRECSGVLYEMLPLPLLQFDKFRRDWE